FTTPDYVRVGGIKAIADGFTKYTPGNGIYELREAISDKLNKDNHIPCTPDNICIAVGAKQAVYSSLMVTCYEGDEVIIPIPCWVSYTEMAKLAGATPVLVPCQENYDLDLAAIEAAITEKTRAIIICTPNNPTGAVYSKETLTRLAELAVEHDFFIIVDEIYEKLIYDGYEHFSIASISQEVWEHTLTINGFSKAYAMTGWRIGYLCARKDIIKAVMSLQSQINSSNCSITQKAAVAALTGPQDDLGKMVEEFIRRKEYVCSRIAAIPGMFCPEPHGAFYVLADIKAFLGKRDGDWVINNGYDLSEYLLSKELISTVPGEAYNIEGKIRFSYSNSMENLKEAFDRIERALARLS
ncbi:MAG: pyridoxal phosphate-dependent aminotransferase, partial [Firmicutes bacterium]|nr:pyridoxal phosphate-dependent aminotransferase [Bacillota bacterium]